MEQPNGKVYDDGVKIEEVEPAPEMTPQQKQHKPMTEAEKMAARIKNSN